MSVISAIAKFGVFTASRPELGYYAVSQKINGFVDVL